MSASPNSAHDALQTIEQFVSQVGGDTTKQAAVDQGSHTEPGGYDGQTSHQSKNVQDDTEEARTGEQAADNEKEVKDDHGQASVNAGNESKNAMEGNSQAHNPSTQANQQYQIGTNVQSTGQDPSSETESTKPGKEDSQYEGSSTHPARTDNDQIDGHKWAKEASLDQLVQRMQKLGNEICSELSQSGDGQTPEKGAQKQAEGDCPHGYKSKDDCPTCDGDGGKDKQSDDAEYQKLAQAAGAELAGLATGRLDKQAAEQMVTNSIEQVIKEAQVDADRTADYLDAYFAKAGEEEGKSEEDQEGKGDSLSGDGSRESSSSSGGDSNSGSKDSGNSKQSTGETSSGGEDATEGQETAPAGGGGEDPAALMSAMGGEDPAAGGGEEMAGAPAGGGDEMAGAPAGGGGEEDMMAQLGPILEQLGVAPEEVAQALEEVGQGEIAPPEQEMPPEMAGGGAMPGMEATANANGKKQASSEKLAQIENYIKEVVSRSRAHKAAKMARARK